MSRVNNKCVYRRRVGIKYMYDNVELLNNYLLGETGQF